MLKYKIIVTNPAGCTSTSYISISASNPLPVELLQFEGSDSNEGNVILWTTATEVSNDYFILEHSIDAVSWKSLVRMEGAGTSGNINYYKFIHQFPDPGPNYYRLRQYDFDGSVRISAAIEVNFRLRKSNPEIVIYPNPSMAGVNDMTISVTSVENSGVLSILDLNGKVLFIKKINVDVTSTVGAPIFIKIQNTLPQGVYSVKWSDAFNLAVSRLMVY